MPTDEPSVTAVVWRKGTAQIAIHTPCAEMEMRTVDAWRADGVPGLVVARMAKDREATWRVTHEASGFAVSAHRTLHRAKRALLALAPLTDWTRDRASIMAENVLGMSIAAVRHEVDQ